MPTEERPTKSAERCASHPATAAIGSCDACGRGVCLACAIPVRGRVLGSECLPADVPSEDVGDPVPEPTLVRAAGLALVAGALTTALPWTRFGDGGKLFGAWRLSLGWSTLAAAAAVVGAGLWLLARGRALGPWLAAALAALGGVLAAAALLAFLHPPSFLRSSVTPLLAVVAGVAALVAGALASRNIRRPGV